MSENRLKQGFYRKKQPALDHREFAEIYCLPQQLKNLSREADCFCIKTVPFQQKTKSFPSKSIDIIYII